MLAGPLCHIEKINKIIKTFKYYLFLSLLPINTICPAQSWEVKDTLIDGKHFYIYPEYKKICCTSFVDYWLVDGKTRVSIPVDGIWIQFYEENKNKVATVFEIHEGKLHGKWTRFYFNQIIERTGSYCNGTWCGEWKEYFENGNIKLIKNYINDESYGLSRTFYESGNLKSVGKYIGWDYDSIWTYYYENGNLKYRLEYDSGQLISDTLMVFYDNGKLERKGKITHDLLYEGEWKFYYINSKLKSSGSHIIAQIDVCKNAMSEKVHYSLRNDEWLFYYDSGELLAKIKYKIVKRLRPRHTLIHNLFIKKSKISRQRFYDKNGNRLSRKFIMDNNIIDIENIKTWHNNGEHS